MRQNRECTGDFYFGRRKGQQLLGRIVVSGRLGLKKNLRRRSFNCEESLAHLRWAFTYGRSRSVAMDTEDV